MNVNATQADTTNKVVIRGVLATSLPELPLKGLRLRTAGEAFDTWEAGDVVVKFPKTRAHAAKIDAELAVRKLLADRMGALMPAVWAIGEPTDEFPFRCIAFERARGRQGQTIEGPIIQPKPWARTSLAREAGGALSTLHAVPLSATRSAKFRRREPAVAPHVDVSEGAVARARKVVGQTVDTFLVNPISETARKPGPAVLCHADLKGEHIFVSEDGTRITALIDWADATVADPAVDFAGLAVWLGPSFVRDALAAYTGPADDGTYERAVFLARAAMLDHLDAVLSGREAATPAPVIDAQLRAVFAPD